MNERDFCYWLKGFFELSGETDITEEQAAVIKEHLDLVFDKVTTKEVTPNPKVKKGSNQSLFDPDAIVDPNLICNANV